jgi:hypothetical protein
MLPRAHTQGQCECERMHKVEGELPGEEVCCGGGFPEQQNLLLKEVRDEEGDVGLETTTKDLLKRKEAVQEVRPTREGRFLQGT